MPLSVELWPVSPVQVTGAKPAQLTAWSSCCAAANFGPSRLIETGTQNVTWFY